MPIRELIRRPPMLVALVLACVAGVGLGLALASDDGDSPGAAGDPSEATRADDGRSSPAPEPSGEGVDRKRPGTDEAPPDGEAAPDEGPSAAELAEVEAERAVRDYVSALVARAGERVCARFVPGALDDFKLPVERGNCGESVSASIGYRDPRGFPQWDGAEIEAIRSTEVTGDEARVTATIVSEFADRDEPSVEDDVIYLRRAGDRWLIAAPSAILYRAVGAPDVPPQVLAPPG